MKSKMKRRIAVLFMTMACLMMISSCGLREPNKMDNILEVENKAGEKYQAVGIAWDKHVLLHKTNGEKIFFPRELVKDAKDVTLLLVKKDGTVASSGYFSLAGNKRVVIEKVREKEIELDVSVEHKEDNKIILPPLDKWKVNADENHIKASFSADTQLEYMVYVLGSGGELGISDKATDKQGVIASWEKSGDQLDSWLYFSL